MMMHPNNLQQNQQHFIPGAAKSMINPSTSAGEPMVVYRR